MDPQGTPWRRRETFLALILAVSLGVAVTLFFLLVSGQYFFAILAVLAGMFLLGLLQYMLWGWPMRREFDAQGRSEQRP